ncbi:MAG: hypothetical protein ABII25_06165 [bacterium]
MKKFIIFLLLQLSIISQMLIAASPLELQLREIRDEYRHSPYDGAQKIEKLWDDFSDVDDRLRIFLDLNHYYQKHSLDKLLLKQGKWLLKKNIPPGKSRIWVIIPIAETFAKQKDFNEAVNYYEKAFIKEGVDGVSLWGGTAINASLAYANAKKFEDAYAILNSAKTITHEEGIKSGHEDIEYERAKIRIAGLIEGKSNEAREHLKLLNKGKPYLTIEPETIQTAEEKLCLKDNDYELLTDIYLNTLIINPPCDLFTYKRITCNGRSTIYVLSKLLKLFKKEKFCVVFEKGIKEKLKKSNLPNINLLLAEYYFYRKNYEQADFYYQIVIKQGKNQIYRWPKYYPDLNLYGNYQSPHRNHLWVTCYEWAKGKILLCPPLQKGD